MKTELKFIFAQKIQLFKVR